MKLKFTRLIYHEDTNTYLSQKYRDKGNLKELIEGYEDGRKWEKDELYLTDTKAREMKDKSIANTSWELFINLVIGLKEAAYYLALSLINGYGIIQNEFLMYLTMAIGVKLGDKNTSELVGSDPIPLNAQKLADKCIVQIKWHEADVQNRDVSWEERIARAKLFDRLVQQESGTSYCDAIKKGSVMKNLIDFVEVEDINQIQPPIPPRVNNYTPQPANTTINTTYNVKAMGQHPQEKDHCKIC